MAPELVAAWALLALTAYGVLGGADYGGGIWDLCARGLRAGAQREAIAAAMGPVWEANHVWLIFLLVLLACGFPRGYAVLSVAMFVPGHLVLLGIVLRGAAFIFRDQGGAARRWWSPVFGAASAATPLLLGMSLGTLSDGAIRVADGRVSFSLAAWCGPAPLLIGALALAVCAYLAAVYLTNETDGELREDFRRRGMWTLLALVILSLGGLPILHAADPHLWAGLMGGSLPIIVLGFLAASASGVCLARRRFALARAAAVAYAAALLVGWGLAQHPYLIYPDVPLRANAAGAAALAFILWTVPLGMLLLAPSLVLLVRVFKPDARP